jgi:hypothetical protein
MTFLTITFAGLALLLGAPAAAEPPGGVPPGQAKKGGPPGHAGRGDADVGISVQIGGERQPGRTRHKGGPPPWAPAHGYRAKHQYRYWPGQQVYFAPERGLYFWLGQDGWQMGANLPGGLRLSGDAVTLDMDAARPYQWHREVVRRYPPR